MSLFAPAATRPSARALASGGQVIALTDLDPELARFLPADRRAGARDEVPVRLVGLPRGPWPVADLAAHPAHLGVLVVEGILGRELIVEDVTSAH